MKRWMILITMAAAATGCDLAPEQKTDRPQSEARAAAKSAAPLSFTPSTFPGAAGAGEPFVSTDRQGNLLLSWLERIGETGTHRLQFSRRIEGRWSPPVSVVHRDDLFVNWADFPSVVAANDGTLVAHWLQKNGEDTYAYDIRVSLSRDGGRTWAEPFVLHDDNTAAEHGFVSLVPMKSGAVAAAWVDGRAMAGGHGHSDKPAGAMAVRYAEISTSGSVTQRAILDERTCECCQTGMTVIDDSPVVVYRDRSETEIRDTGSVKRVNGTWSAPAAVHSDGWKIEACPVNGPQIDSIGQNTFVAWFTSAGGTSSVRTAFSKDGGASFGSPVVIDGANPVGRVDLVMIDSDTALVIWVSRRGTGADVVARTVDRNGALGNLIPIAPSSAARSAGFPRATKASDGVWVAWTSPGTPPTVKLARAAL